MTNLGLSHKPLLRGYAALLEANVPLKNERMYELVQLEQICNHFRRKQRAMLIEVYPGPEDEKDYSFISLGIPDGEFFYNPDCESGRVINCEIKNINGVDVLFGDFILYDLPRVHEFIKNAGGVDNISLQVMGFGSIRDNRVTNYSFIHFNLVDKMNSFLDLKYHTVFTYLSE